MTQNTRNIYRLLGLVKCRSCGEVMISSHDPEHSYICLTREKTGPDDCPTPPIGTEFLDRLVTAELLDSVLTEGNLKKVVNIVQKGSRRETLEHLKEIGRINEELTEQDRARRGLVTAVEHERTTFAETATHLEELNKVRANLNAQADQAKTELDIQETVSDERRIRANVREADTYLQATDQETVREMFRTFIEEVLVGATNAAIRYTIPIPRDGHPAGSYTQELTLV